MPGAGGWAAPWGPLVPVTGADGRRTLSPTPVNLIWFVEPPRSAFTPTKFRNAPAFRVRLALVSCAVPPPVVAERIVFRVFAPRVIAPIVSAELAALPM